MNAQVVGGAESKCATHASAMCAKPENARRAYKACQNRSTLAQTGNPIKTVLQRRANSKHWLTKTGKTRPKLAYIDWELQH